MNATLPAARPLIRSHDGVYVPEADSRMLLDAFERHGRSSPSRVLDLCCGTGLQGIAAAFAGHEVVAVDADRRAVSCTQRNAMLNGVHFAVRQGDLFEPVHGDRFDVVLANPPYVPTPPHGAFRRHCWSDGGSDGRRVIDRIIRGVKDHLAPGGELWMVQSSLAATHRSVSRLEQRGFVVSRVSEREQRFGPVSVERLRYLRAYGFAADDGLNETLTVLRATPIPRN